MPRQIKQTLIFGSLVISALLIMLYLPISFGGGGDHPMVGKEAPDFKARALVGNPHGPGDKAGRLVLLDFWASWCGPCRTQMPIAAEVAHRNPDVALLPVNLDKDGSKRLQDVTEFMDDTAPGTNTLLDDGTAARLYRVSRFPTLMLVDWNGQIRWASEGVASAEKLESVINDVRRGKSVGVN